MTTCMIAPPPAPLFSNSLLLFFGFSGGGGGNFGRVASLVRSGGKPLTPLPLPSPSSARRPPWPSCSTGCCRCCTLHETDGGTDDGPDDRMIIIFCSLSVTPLCCGSNLSRGEKRGKSGQDTSGWRNSYPESQHPTR